MIEVEAIAGIRIWVTLYINGIDMSLSDLKWQFSFVRRQFPIKVCLQWQLTKFNVKHSKTLVHTCQKLYF
ncbi:hypothetical protein, partial [Spiroplasma sp. ChiS]|uniref:hypothetical protein n=1 Tax=Spiroplasma sp. ChiS TaxID=2099885 RepID=UPI001F4592EB